MSYTAELIAVGTELLLGNISNTDAQMLSQGLSALGINVYYHTVVGDNPDRLRAAVELARTRADILITTGGLGPTCDDLTKTVLAECFGKKLVFHAPSARRIEDYFRRLHPNRPMTDNNYQQAMLPEGCTVLDNDWGTAPGVAFEAEGIRVIMLPGPPRECKAMFTHRVIPYLKELADGVIVSRTLKLFGIGESSMEAQLREKMNAMTNPTLAPYAKEGECELRITAKAPDEGAAHALIDPVEADLKAHFGPLVYGVDIPNLERAVLDGLKAKGLTLGTAESCTGGLAAKRFTDLPGASAAFRGGIVSYATQVKHTVLGVPEALLDQYGAVSQPVARAMAEGARRVLGCDLALSFTGVAGPDPDERNNPVGLVFIALAAPEGTWVRQVNLSMGRERIRHIAASHGFDLARRYLNGLELK
ncbi:competence/damage-inducible protein A [Pseudoflavonifractor phocaeensis]|uniref:competence/damage-inducible protein A n=1 Tax=Pseudoflavonifractor phocaeensis TaxID=1870988 RepID=UPI0019576449|nr:competence/damage-inducible protein A [Pseudoflavonifractor phocaeensis]MBM6926155.1 competence/damage-inducible protein A [Pseudoflavonifractor phocaeensis]